MNKLKILFAASEVAPFAKTGGLADVAGSLPAALASQGHQVVIVMPFYRSVRESSFNLKRYEKSLFIPYQGQKLEAGIYTTKLKRNAQV